MTQTPVQRQPFKWLVDLSSDDDKTLTMGRACLQAACRGSDRIGSLLNYFIFKASQEAKKQGLTMEGCKVVTLKLTLEEILRGLHHSVSKKTLISYLHKLNIWEFVASQPYHREYGVNVENIDKTIKAPPPAEKKLRGIHAKGCNSTTLQPSKSELLAKVVELQEKVVILQSEIVDLHHLIVILQPFDSSEASSDAGSTGNLEALDNRDSNRFLESNNDSSESPYIAGYREVSQNKRLNSSAIMEPGALDALPVVTQQPAHPEEPMRASIESTNHSLPIAIGPTSPTSSSHVQPAMATPGFSYPMATGNTSPFMQHNGSSANSTPTPVDDIPSQPASLGTDAGSGLSSDAAMTTSNTDKQRDGVQGRDTSEVVQGNDTGLSTKETEEKANHQITPEGVENSTVRRQPKAKKAIDAVMQKRIDSFYSALDEFMQEVMEDTAAKYQRYKKGTEAIHDLLEAHTVTKVRLHKVFFDMWNEKNRDEEYFWRKHMKPHNICSEYESRIMALEGKSNGNGNKGNGHASPSGLHTLSGAPFIPAEKLPVAPRVPSKRRLYARETTPQ